MPIADSHSLQGKTALISGAADGIGRAAALLLGRHGAFVIGWDRDAKGVRGLQAEFGRQGLAGSFHRVDVLSERDVTRAARAATRAKGVDILVNVVGGSTAVKDAATALESMSLGEWNGLIAFNLTGTFLCTRAVVPEMKRRRYGRIINLSSIAAQGWNQKTSAAYAAAKGAIEAMTRKLAVELGPDGITCNAISPGITLTRRIEERFWRSRSEKEKAAVLQAIPLRRLATAEDQARAILFLASDEAAYISGQIIRVNGGP